MKDLTIALCVDEKWGLTFNGRRQSRDRLLIKELCESTSGKIYIDGYSAQLFEEYPGRTAICSSLAEECPDGAVCFVENIPPERLIANASRLIIYCWCRDYPRSTVFDPELLNGFTEVSAHEFVGSSHERITKGIYQR